MSEAGQDKDLIVSGQQDIGQPRGGILKRDMGALVTWFGRRTYDEEYPDLGSFKMQYKFYGDFNLYDVIAYPDADEREEARPSLEIKAAELADSLGRIITPLAIFVVLTPRVAEYPEFDHFPRGLRTYLDKQGKDDAFIYKIIMGGGAGFKKEGPIDPKGHFSQNAMRAHQLDAVYLPYNRDYQTIGGLRLVEFMNRTFGSDLPGKEFPDYSIEDLRKIAWSLGKENFSRRSDAIEKYPIIDGRPLFPF